jgi:RimJ/RimL family protein N-acetyltransferase
MPHPTTKKHPLGAKPRAYRPQRVSLLDGRRATIRAIRAQDAGEIVQAFHRLSDETRYARFMQHMKTLDPALLARGTQPVAGQEVALVATVPAADGIDIVGGVRYVSAGRPGVCEFSITVADGWRGTGLANTLLRRAMRQARLDGYHTMEGNVLTTNQAMLALAKRMKFERVAVPDDATVCVVRRPL